MFAAMHLVAPSFHFQLCSSRPRPLATSPPFELKTVTILIAQIARADRSLKVKALITVGRARVALGTRHLAPNREMGEVDLADQVERRARIPSIAYGIQEISVRVVSVVGELQVYDVLCHWHRQVSADLSH